MRVHHGKDLRHVSHKRHVSVYEVASDEEVARIENNGKIRYLHPDYRAKRRPGVVYITRKRR